jgi:L-idonate 5-dehydrogenase
VIVSAQCNHAIVIHGAGDVRVEERAEPLPGEGQVQVHIEVGGICGSDLSYYKYGAVGDFKVKRPMVLGHEVVGVVSKVGAGVSGGLESTRVAVDPSSPCFVCERCKEGRFNVCLNPVFLGSASTDPHVDGGFSSMLVTKAANLVEVPAGIDMHDVVFAEPLAVTVHALNRAGGANGKRVLVVGAGPIGAMAAAAALRFGAGEVVVTDLSDDRLAIATSLGVHQALRAQEASFDNEFDLVLEASGSGPGIAAAIKATRKGGAMVLVGLPHGGPVELPIGMTVAREMDLLGSFRFTHDEFRTAVDLLGDGLDLSPLRSGSYEATDASDAFESALGASTMKVQVDFASLN